MRVSGAGGLATSGPDMFGGGPLAVTGGGGDVTIGGCVASVSVSTRLLKGSPSSCRRGASDSWSCCVDSPVGLADTLALDGISWEVIVVVQDQETRVMMEIA